MKRSIERVLVTSFGSIGRRHLRNLRSLLPKAELAVLRRPGSAMTAEGEVRVFQDLSSALAFRPDASIVASPATYHLALAQALVDARIPVLVEKPLADRLDGLTALVASANQNGTPLYVAYNLRFHPLLQRVKSLLEKKEIGRVLMARVEVGQYLPDWRTGQPYREGVSARRELGGGALLELSHEIDYVSWLFGRPRRLFASGGQLGDLDIDVEDAIALTLRYDTVAPIVTVNLDFLQRLATRQLRIVGTEGTLLADLISGELSLYLSTTGSYARESRLLVDGNQPYLDEISAFLSVLTGGEAPLLASGQQGIDVVCQVEAARKSMAEQREVEIDYV